MYASPQSKNETVYPVQLAVEHEDDGESGGSKQPGQFSTKQRFVRKAVGRQWL